MVLQGVNVLAPSTDCNFQCPLLQGAFSFIRVQPFWSTQPWVLPRSPADFLASCLGISKNIPLLFTCKIKTSGCFLLHQWMEWRTELLCECMKQKQSVLALSVHPCCKGLSSISPGSREQLASACLSPVSQTCHPTAASTQRQIASFYHVSSAKNVLYWSCGSPVILHA